MKLQNYKMQSTNCKCANSVKLNKVLTKNVLAAEPYRDSISVSVLVTKTCIQLQTKHEGIYQLYRLLPYFKIAPLSTLLTKWKLKMPLG